MRVQRVLDIVFLIPDIYGIAFKVLKLLSLELDIKTNIC